MFGLKRKQFTLLFLASVCFLPLQLFAEVHAGVKNGVINFAVYSEFPPYSYKDENGKATGIDVELAKALAKELGVRANIRVVNADESLLDDLRVYVWKGHHVTGAPADVMLHVPYDEFLMKQEDKVNFIAPYAEEQVVVAADTEQLGNNPQMTVFFSNKIGVERLTMAAGYLSGAYQGRIRDNIVPFITIPEAVEALFKKEVTAVMGTRTEIDAALGDAKGNYQVGLMSMPGIAKASWDLGLAVKASNEALTQSLQAAMDKLVANGTVKQLFNKYGTSHHTPAARIIY